MKFCDAHTHKIGIQENGFLIALDGNALNQGGYSNDEVIEAAKNAHMIPVQYVTSDLSLDLYTKGIKFHPRREGYSVKEVYSYIKKYGPRLVIIDTLNKPDWQPADYWKLLRKCEDVQFLLSHAGGYDILDFLEMAVFEDNGWIDFSFSQNYFGWCKTGESTMPYVTMQMDYAMKDARIFKNLLFGTDNLLHGDDLTEESLMNYKKYNSCSEVVYENFYRLLGKAGL